MPYKYISFQLVFKPVIKQLWWVVYIILCAKKKFLNLKTFFFHSISVDIPSCFCSDVYFTGTCLPLTENENMFKPTKRVEQSNRAAHHHSYPIFGLYSLSHGRQAGEEVLALAEDQQD